MATFPPYLSKGSIIGILCPSGYMPYQKAANAIETLTGWGFRVVVGKTLGNRFHYFSGTDEERINDLQMMMDDKNIHAIFCARGGYGLGRIIDKLSFKKFKQNPKWIIGFSDVTVLQSHLLSKYKIASLHAPMASAFNDGESSNQYVKSLHDALIGRKANYSINGHEFNKKGNTSGILVGGNLSLLVHLVGTPSGIRTKNTILFIEDVGEYIYNIDRMMYQLKRSGKLDELKALIVGAFTEMKDTTLPFGSTAEEVIKDVVQEYDYPICFNFPVSHNKENFAMKIGAKYRIMIDKSSVNLKEI